MKKILITRTDRIGDVVLSTPVFRAVREAYPESHIAVLVRPYARDVVDGNPYIDEVIVYDKYGAHKSIFASFKFCLGLMKKRFNLAIILHPTNRMHIITALAGIPERVGFNRKAALFLTKRIPHTKQLGQMHEVDYTLGLIRAIGIEPTHTELYFPVKRGVEKICKEKLVNLGVSENDLLVAIHPAASCASKRWPALLFAGLADELIMRFEAKIIFISSPGDKKYTKDVLGNMRHKALDFSGKTRVRELGAMLKQCGLLVSNDSGPVHIAVAVNCPVIAIFGRKDPGLRPARWKPLGKKTEVFHKDVGCQPCLAHNCVNKFKCLSAISVEEVLEAAGKLLKVGGQYDKVTMSGTESEIND